MEKIPLNKFAEAEVQKKTIVMNCKKIYILYLLLATFSLSAQVGENSNDCTYSKEILIPFNYSATDKVVKPILNQNVFYSHRDQFTFWYKIIAKENATLSFMAHAVNDSDSYAMFVYQYNAPDFCEKLYYGKTEPVKSSFFTGNKASFDPYDLSEKTFQAIKGNTYYISILNTSLTNCGHNFMLINAKDTLRVKAVHFPCKRDLSVLSVKAPLFKDSLASHLRTQPKIISPRQGRSDSLKTNSLVCTIKDNKKGTPLKAKPFIINAAGDILETEQTTEGSWRCTVEQGKSYKIKCQSLGYKASEQLIEIKTDQTTANILLEPLKPGDFFIMKSIYFFPNTYALKKESAGDLQKLLIYMNENPNAIIEIQGHTNGDHHVAKNKAYSSLSEEWNFRGSAKELSQKRAEVIKIFLENNGISGTRLVPKGYGGKKPIIKYPQDNEEGQMNIRVEIVILKN